ncbi:porin [Hyphomicrobium sp.]|uniref:porin n=1 Tax=Hyphomicrobium sp. TaxID=82 RepID=UPI003F72E256
MSHIKKCGLIGLFAAASVAFGASAGSAADLGGACCADLEERIAELESSVASKGNRKVSLVISGWVTEQVVSWDDGVESNTYVTGLGTAFASNVNFKGQAQVTKDVSVGYVLHVEIITSDVYTTNASNPRGGAALSGGGPNSLQVLYSYWFAQSETYGRVSVGVNSPADDSAVVALDSSGTLQAAYWVAYDVFGFNVRGNFAPGDSLIWGNASSCRGYGGGPGDCNGVPLNVIRYDSPVIANFSASASWGADDNWAVALRYINTKFGDMTVKALATYSETSDEAQGAPVGGNLEYTQASVYLQHNPSGWFAHGAWGHIDQNVNPQNNPASDTYYIKSGIRLKPLPIGATIPYGEYLKAKDSAFIVNDSGTPGDSSDDVARVVSGSEATFWGFGVAQEIDAAAMTVWLRYREHEVDVPGVQTRDMSTIVFGGFINF